MVVNIEGAVTGNASTATALATARTIGGVSFDGTSNINLPGVNAGGNQATSGNAATATALANARTIGGVSFNGTANINLPGVNATGNQATSGNAATATTLATARSIGMTGDVVWTSPTFDGSGNVTATATIQANSVTMGTDTTGNYVAAITAGTGLTSNAGTSGENIAHTLSVDAAQTQITSVGTIGTGTWQGTAVAQGYIGAQAINESKMQISNAPTNGYLLTARSGNTGGMTWEPRDADPAGTGIAMSIALG